MPAHTRVGAHDNGRRERMMAGLTRLEPGTFRKIDIRLALLTGQSLSLGVLLSLLIITASALFLTRFGSQMLSYVYIVVAILGVLVFYGYAELQRRFPLPSLSLATVGAIRRSSSNTGNSDLGFLHNSPATLRSPPG